MTEGVTSRRKREGCYEPLVGRPTGERPLVQILVVVANIQMRTLKTEVEKGSM